MNFLIVLASGESEISGNYNAPVNLQHLSQHIGNKDEIMMEYHVRMCNIGIENECTLFSNNTTVAHLTQKNVITDEHKKEHC